MISAIIPRIKSAIYLYAWWLTYHNCFYLIRQALGDDTPSTKPFINSDLESAGLRVKSEPSQIFTCKSNRKIIIWKPGVYLCRLIGYLLIWGRWSGVVWWQLTRNAARGEHRRRDGTRNLPAPFPRHSLSQLWAWTHVSAQWALGHKR